MNLPYGFKIKYDDDGKAFLRVLRSVFKQTGGPVLKLHGRGHRMGVRRYRQGLPLKYATHVRVYTR